MFTSPLMLSTNIYPNKYSTFFNGVDDRIDIGNNASLNITNNLTLACWIKTTATVDTSFISRYRSAGSNRQYLIGMTAAGQLRSLISADGGTVNFKDYNSNATTINDGAWHFVATTFVSNVLKLYVDGVEITTSKPTNGTVNTLFNATLPVFQFSSIDGNPTLWRVSGNLDDAAVWDTTVLTTTEILALYNNGKPLDVKKNHRGYTSKDNVVSNWKMGDGDNATTLFDRTSNNDGTLINMSDVNYIEDVA